MMRTLAIAVLLVSLRPHDSAASCAYVAPQAAKLVVDRCTAVDTTKMKDPARASAYAGLLVEGTLTSGKGKPAAGKVWIPASEKLTCAQVEPRSTVSGTLAFACCDGDSNAPCLIDTSSVFTKLTIAKPAAAKSVKQATRAELEAEVEALRTENAQLRAKFEALYREQQERAKRLEEQLGGKPAKDLK